MAQGGLSLHTSFVDSSSPAHRGSKLAPSEDAVRMANIGATAVPGMTPAEYRQALYHTWMTGEPAGMQYIDFDSDVEVRIPANECGIALFSKSLCCAKWQGQDACTANEVNQTVRYSTFVCQSV